MALAEYQRKRHFNKTPEPEAKLATRSGWSYVIQKHAASHLHYDFRLELDGVLKSWAVPKGPSLDPSVKRLAMQVEDHPVEYGGFEGIIPEGEYGGGTVMLWDTGSWEPVGDPEDGYRQGKLKFQLHGEKLAGGWSLIRTHLGESSKHPQWLLIKEQDEQAEPASKGDVLPRSPLSVVSGRDLDEIAASSDKIWSSKPKSRTQKAASKAPTQAPTQPTVKKASVKPDRSSSAGAKKSSRKKVAREPAEKEVHDQADYDPGAEKFVGVRLTHPDKLLYPEEKITKLELASYYRGIAQWILPHIKHRPLVLVRCPDGLGKESFYQKHPGIGTPDTFRQIPIRESNKTENYVLIDDVGGLISLAQIGALEVHAWGSQEDKLERPDRLIFDLDPSPEVTWARVVESAREIRKFLDELGLASFVKTTGGKGLHLVVPIERRHDWDEAKAFCKAVADAIVAVAPQQYTSNMSKAARTNKIFLDYLRNGRGATAIVPFSPRARPGAPVSMPLAWDELSSEIRSDHFTIRNAMARLLKLPDDPWKELTAVRQSLSTPIKTLKKLGVLS
ncbi:MAG: ATP-dependent ligase [Planctomycetaceae bacterium]|nr:ATP-dependent ligase [Planctomycetaceae bacterium]